MFAVVGILFSLRRAKKLKSLKDKTLIFIAAIIGYAIIQHIAVGEWQEKSYLSIIAFSILLLSAYLVSQEIAITDNKTVLKAFTWSYYSFLAIGFLNIATDYLIGKNFGYTHGKPIFPFLEPSHYALYYGPLSLIYLVTQQNKIKKIISIFLTLGMGLAIPNTTLLIYGCLCISMLIFTLRARTLFLVFPAFIAFVVYGATIVLSNEYFSSRLDVTADKNQNATTLVYLQGLQDTYNSLELTNGLGLGFQMLGTQPPSEYSYSIAKVMSDVNGELNRQDGGFLAAKIISEFGIFGILIILYASILMYKCFLEARKFAKAPQDITDVKRIIFSCIIASFCVEIFIRGYGYFSSGFYLFLVAMFYLSSLKKLIKTKSSCSSNLPCSQPKNIARYNSNTYSNCIKAD
ncbi:hypothetical protein SB766_03530 [Pseudomonas sp. SIMBA_077]